jgi:hypothetical protein
MCLRTILMSALFLFATSLLGQDAYPPPPKDLGPDPFLQPKKALPKKRLKKKAPPPSHPVAPPGKSVDRYQFCFDKMVDAGTTDNNFMRRCLGLPARSKGPQKNKKGELEFLDTRAVNETFAKGMAPLEQCYADHIQAGKKLGITPEGYFEPILKVLADGSVGEVSFSKRTISDVTILACFKKALMTWQFSKFSRRKSLRVLHRFRLAVVNQKGVFRQLKDFPRVEGVPAFTEEEKLEVYRQGTASVQSCYDIMLKSRPGVQGRVGVRLRVSSTGKVRRVTFKENSFHDPVLEKCLNKALMTFKFPPSRSGRSSNVHYPFIFQPAK